MARLRKIKAVVIKERKNVRSEPKNTVLDRSALDRSYVYYAKFYNIEEKRDFIREWAEKNDNILFEKIDKINKKHIVHNVGTICKLLNEGNSIPEDAQEYFNKQIDILKDVEIEDNVVILKKTKVKNYENEIILATENLVDQNMNREISANFDFVEFFRKLNPYNIDLVNVTRYYAPVIMELFNVENDPQITEAYSHYNEYEMNKLRNFYMNMIEACDHILNEGKEQPKNKITKIIPKDKIVKLLKFQSENSEMNLKSLKPIKILDSEIGVFYNEKYNIVTVLYAKNGEKFKVHRTQIIEYDEEKSYSKRLSKPKEAMEKIMTLPKMGMLKYIQEIKNQQNKVKSFYTNENILFIKSY